MEEYIKILEEIVETYRSCSVNEEGFDMKVDIGFTKKECEALESLLTRYKEYGNLLEEIDSKEASDALYMLWHCALINKEFETQKQQFQIVNAYIKQLEEENKELKHITQNYNAYQQKSDNPNSTIIIADEEWFINGYFKENFIPKSKVIEKIKELEDGTYDAKIILQQLLEENTENHIPRID